MVQNVANADQELSDQIFQTLIDVTKEIIPKSHKLTSDYVEMDLKLRELEKNQAQNQLA